MFNFEKHATCGKARLGRINTDHGPVDTPSFMPVGTAGTVKGVLPAQLTDAGVQIILANTYHLMLRPGADTVAALGGVHAVAGWSGPMLTDSGGYQVYSLAHMRKIDDAGATFKSHIDGQLVNLTPAGAIEIQQKLGADIIMQLDECAASTATKSEVAEAVDRSAAWAKLCRDAWDAAGRTAKCGAGHGQALFGIQQGGVHLDLRAKSAEAIVALDLPGYAVGGLSVGEGHEPMCKVLDEIDDLLPAAKPRYLMGVGEPRDIFAAVARGIDTFDCVLPTRNGRNAQAFTWSGRLRLRNAKWALETAPIDENCTCYTCRNYSCGALRHLFMAKEMIGPSLVSIHNLHFFADMMARIRQAIADGDLAAKSAQWLARMYAGSESEIANDSDCD